MAKILSVVPYFFYPPANGGALRCFYLLRALTADHEVTLLTVQPEASFFNLEEPVFPPNVTIISLAEAAKMKSFLNSLLPSRFADAAHTRMLRMSLRESRNELLLKAWPVVKRLSQQMHFDAVIYENLECFTWLRPLVKKRMFGAKQLYDAHNVDSNLWLQYAQIEAPAVMRRYGKKALRAEKRLSSVADCVFTCSTGDLNELQNINTSKLNAMVVPNGVDVELNPFDSSAHKPTLQEILFCGSLSVPANREGIFWFYRSVFPKLTQLLPELRLTVIGQLEDDKPFKELKEDPTVNFVGPVLTVLPYYQNSSVAIVPLLSGSGTRLKILEAMSMGNPVVSTSKGAEGLSYIDGLHLMIGDDPISFGQQVYRLLSDHTLFNSVRNEARQLVQRAYDWRIIGKRFSQKVEELVN